MIGKLGTSAADSEINEKCATLSQKLDSLLQTLQEETEGMGMGESSETEPSSPRDEDETEVGWPLLFIASSSTSFHSFKSINIDLSTAQRASFLDWLWC